MKKVCLLALFAVSVCILNAQQIATPQASTTQSLKQNFSTGYVELSYSRPNVKGRTIFGDLVPYGKVWRTGANGATTLNFSEDVSIGGKDIKAGKYGLLTIPGETEWTLIITKDVDVTSPSAYKMENDIVRVAAKPIAYPNKIETFTMNFGNVTGGSCDLYLLWDKTMIMLPITTNTDARVMKQIDDAMNKDNRPYYASAQYYYDNGKDLAKANEWITKAIAANPDAFWMTMLKARILAKTGDKAGAKTSAQKTIELATTAKNDDYVKMANDLIKTL